MCLCRVGDRTLAQAAVDLDLTETSPRELRRNGTVSRVVKTLTRRPESRDAAIWAEAQPTLAAA